jgi:hypothetical protein
VVVQVAEEVGKEILLLQVMVGPAGKALWVRVMLVVVMLVLTDLPLEVVVVREPWVLNQHMYLRI